MTSNEAAASDSLLSNLFEKLFRLNQKLEVQEDDIFRLTLQVFWKIIGVVFVDASFS